MPVILPTEIQKPTTFDPRTMVIIAATKTGKTSACMQLPKSLLIDLEDSSSFYAGMSVNIKKLSIEENRGMGSLLYETAKVIQQANIDAGKPVYDFIIIDSLSELEKIAKAKAKNDYMKSIIGKNFKGNDIVKELPQGAGYDWLNTAYEELFGLFDGLAAKCIIYVAHKKIETKSAGNREDIKYNDIALVGKLKKITTSKVDAIAYLYRSHKKPNTNVMSFCKDDDDTVYGTRCPHLKNQRFLFSYLNDKEELICNWDIVFTSLNKTKKKMEVMEDEYIKEEEKEVNDDDIPT